ncbi:aspartate-semialdehyde dehydrogenase [Anaeromyxobacter oryzae]|uniref:Aspartate-semialdehyde dehydrogenase n=1 Tax=Anaeromyxobacter oryzae TaxID=2918170 RepID=A0ABM7WSI7_9BACT|nr:aspartate-semialdehyde dehydrogenase [Anaeromyxobacter oryzae]BDG02453.1 aspartate-semialdehyde dehydrogenase [Anaeromyxobacter oryzae]
MPTRPLSLALVGATGLVGRAVLDALAEADLDLSRLKLLASPRSKGTRLEWNEEELPVHALEEGAFQGVDVAIFCVPAEVARAWAPKAWSAGCAVVDGSPAFRAEPDVPLVVPEVNLDAVDGFRARGVVASPSPAVTALAVALAPLQRAAGLERVVVATYQAASGAGHRAVEQLEREATDLMNGREPEAGTVVPHRLAFNLVPQVGSFRPDGRTDEEASLVDETRRVLGAPGLGVAATAVRVPVFFGLGAAVNVATARPLPAAEAREVLRKAPGVKVIDDPAAQVYPMPMLAVNDDAVLVGRVRDDPSQRHGLDLFLVSDDLRRGAATNLVRIAAAVAARR